VVRRQKDELDESEQVYSTNEGDVYLSISGSGVFVSEGFDLALARKLRDRIQSVQSDAPLQVAGEMEMHEPALTMAHALSSFGVLKASGIERYTSEGHNTAMGPDHIR
jgi:hypothetical protein